MATYPLMPKATAVWLVENTSLTFEQIAAFCGLHALEVQGIADGEVAGGIQGLDPIANNQLTKDEIERSISIIHRAVGGPTAPFFRFPFLRASPESLKYLADRNIAVFSTDIDSFDFKRTSSQRLVKHIMKLLDKRGKGILLMHDIQPHTAKAMPDLLKALKENGYKVVQLTAKEPVKPLPEYDELVAKDMKGMPTALTDRPMNSVVRTISGE